LDSRHLQQDFFRGVAPATLTRIFDALPEVYYFAKDLDGRFVGLNRSLVRTLGLRSERELLGRTDYEVFDRRLADAYRAEDQRVMDANEPLLDQIWHVPGGGGRLRWYISSKFPLTDENGEVVGIAGVMRDVNVAGSVLAPYDELAPVIQHITDHSAEELSVPELAAMAHMSVSRFERQFKRLFGTTPLKYINRVRLDNACDRLVTTDDPISRIAVDVGFYDHSYFSKRFQAAFAITPKAYRSSYR
jgi:PAS domain S-box-containing protein